MLERSVRRSDSASRLAPPGASAEAVTLVVIASAGNTAGSPSASSRELKLPPTAVWQRRRIESLLERRSASRLAPSGASAEAATLVVIASAGNTAGSPSASSRELKLPPTAGKLPA
ncbi:hypothetical protein LY622_00205, partial [Halomonas sp. M5N1S17]|uniref:hypothetical protein n=1 Tax=Halomonas alkalisoli TaxID=2907158 RepID=UPI001F2DF99F